MRRKWEKIRKGFGLKSKIKVYAKSSNTELDFSIFDSRFFNMPV